MSASTSPGNGLTANHGSALPGRTRSTLIRDIKERLILGTIILCGVITISITILILFILAREASGFFGGGITDVQGREANVSLTDFLFTLEWNPLQGSEKEFGIWPLIVGTFQVTIVAMCIAIPVGLMVAIWLSEFAPPKARAILKPMIEIIAGVPTVVFGYFALTFVTPLLQLNFGDWYTGPRNPFDIQIFNVLAAGLTVGIMCIPIVASLSEDALRAVPRALREGAYGLGSSRFETSVKVVFPAALSGVVAACLLAFARAVGETMIVALAAGLNPPDLVSGLGRVFELNQGTQTMTGYMVSVFFGDITTQDSVEYKSVYAVGMTLFLITLVITIIGAYIRKRFRQQYE
ncbi:MAG: phosphate ABC transporter permease subunit PstC [Planctomycetota bacterium]